MAAKKTPTKSVEKKERPLTAKEKLFAKFYVADMNTSEAVLKAGYRMTKESSYVQGCVLLKKPKIQEEIARLQAALVKRTEITAERVIAEMAKIAFSNIGGLFDPKTGNLKKVDQMDPNDLAAVSGISIDDLGGTGRQSITTKKIRMYDKIRALEKLGLHLGLFKEKPETSEELISVLKEAFKNLPD